MRLHPCILLITLAGCAATQPQSDPNAFPLDLAGDNTHLHIVLGPPQASASADADGLLDDQEFCYLSIDKVTIECFPFGSLLMLGPDDAVELVYDNPLEVLRPGNSNRGAQNLLSTISIVGLIAASIDRVPDSLADYIDADDSQNPAAARALAELLLQPGGAQFDGFSRAGPFTINVDLTDDGRETLQEALADRQTSDARLVRSGRSRIHRRKTATSQSAVPLLRALP